MSLNECVDRSLRVVISELILGTCYCTVCSMEVNESTALALSHRWRSRDAKLSLILAIQFKRIVALIFRDGIISLILNFSLLLISTSIIFFFRLLYWSSIDRPESCIWCREQSHLWWGGRLHYTFLGLTTLWACRRCKVLVKKMKFWYIRLTDKYISSFERSC